MLIDISNLKENVFMVVMAIMADYIIESIDDLASPVAESLKKDYFYGTILKETDKAYLAEITVTKNLSYSVQKTATIETWLPKSQTDILRTLDKYEDDIILTPYWLSNKIKKAI